MDIEINRIIELLSKTDVFDGIESAQLRQLANTCHFKNYQDGELIIAEGEAGDGFYVIIEGQLKVVLPKSSNKGKERFTQVKLNTLESGDCFGEYSLIDEHVVSASIVSVGQTSILKINKVEFQLLMDNDLLLSKTLYHNLLKLFISRLRKHDSELDMFLVS